VSRATAEQAARDRRNAQLALEDTAAQARAIAGLW
jgi:hypothetical protein